MHSKYTIECTCSHGQEPLQITFARRAIDLLPTTEETAFEARADGLAILAETESALERQLELLREVYGEQLRISPPSIRYRTGASTDEPHMQLRVLVPPQCFDSIKADLEQRGARILDSELTHQFGVLRATARLAALLGYAHRFDEITASRGNQVMWLSHYAPMEPQSR